MNLCNASATTKIWFTLLAGFFLLVPGLWIGVQPTTAHPAEPGTGADPIAQAASQGVGPVPCDNGLAGGYPCQQVDLLAHMSLTELGGGSGSEGANLWGWTDPLTGREYVLFGLTDSTAFIDITDPLSPVRLGNLPTQTVPSAKYRDIKVYQDHAFIVADFDSLHGLQVFDLTGLRAVITPTISFTATTHYDMGAMLGDTHNLHINEDSGFAYLLRTTTPDLCSGVMTMIDVRNPANPAFAGCFEQGGLASDAICVNYHGPDPQFQGREVCVIASDDDIVIADVTDKDDPQLLKQLVYTNIGRAHNAWITPDHRFFVSADMNDEMDFGLNTRVFVWDFGDVDNPTLKGVYTGPSAASDHNIWIAGHQAYVGNFRAGLQILDTFEIHNGQLALSAYFDLVPGDDNAGHDGGAWAVYPFFSSGVLAVSDKTAGLFLLQPRLKTPQLWLPLTPHQSP